MTLDVIIYLRASVCYSLSRMVCEHTGNNQPTLISESCVVCPIIHSKQITARVSWREQGSVHEYACHIYIYIYILISNILSMLQDLMRGAECSLLLLNVIILAIFFCIL